MRRHELSDEEWSVIAPLLPTDSRGIKRVDDRRVINGFLWRFRTGSSWRDIPERYGPRTTLYNRFSRWRKAGVWDRLLDAVSKRYDKDIVMIDSSCVRVHQHGANATYGPAVGKGCRNWLFSLHKRIRPSGRSPWPRWRSARFAPHKGVDINGPF